MMLNTHGSRRRGGDSDPLVLRSRDHRSYVWCGGSLWCPFRVVCLHEQSASSCVRVQIIQYSAAHKRQRTHATVDVALRKYTAQCASPMCEDAVDEGRGVRECTSKHTRS